MSDLKSSILALIRDHHKGRAAAITIAQIVYDFIDYEVDPLDERTVRKLIRDLNFEGYPILTTVHRPWGVYYATTKAEIDEYCMNLQSRMKSILDRLRAIDRIRAKEFLKVQMELFV